MESATPSTTRRSAFRPDIEGLRGIAILIVVLFHCGVPGAAAGFVGVDVFFVLSGYLITGLLVNEIESTGRVNLPQFYARRVRRLLPAAALVTIVTLVIAAMIFAPKEIRDTGRAARATAVYLSNVFFATNAADYFAADVESNPMLHTWSLAVEEQFYLFWPALVMAALQWWRSRRALVAVLSSVTVASLLLSLRMTYVDTNSAFYLLPTRAWEFGTGGLAVLLQPSSSRFATRSYTILSWFGLATLGAATALRPEHVPFPGWLAIPPVLATAAVLVAAAGAPRGGVAPLVGSSGLQFLGKLSYSWYLWHWPFLVFAQALLPGLSVIGKVATAGAALGVAAIAHRLVENPLRFHPTLVKRTSMSLAFGAALMVLTLGASLGSLRFASTLARSPAMESISAAAADIADLPRDACVTRGVSAEVKTCTFGADDSATTLVLFGDSHAIQWFNAFLAVAETNRWHLVTLFKSGCPAYDFVRSESSQTDAEYKCRAWRQGAVAEIARIRPAAVILGSANGYFGSETSRLTDVQQWREGARRTYDVLRRGGIRIVALRDTPRPGFDVPTCLARSIRLSRYPGGDCRFSRNESLDTQAFDAEVQAANKSADISFLDVTDEVCRTAACPSRREEMILYRDDNHLTGTFARSLAPIVGARLRAILGNRLHDY